jgi:hypothetical protein
MGSAAPTIARPPPRPTAMAREQPTNLQRRLLDWADDASHARYFDAGQRQQIEAALADPRASAALAVAAWMHGTWWLGHGQARVLRGEQRGWDEARAGLRFQLASLQLRRRRFDGGSLPAPAEVQQLADASGIALAMADPDAEEPLDLCRRLPDAALTGSGWTRFVRELLALRAGARPAVSPRLGPYEEVVAHWTGDEELLARRLAGLLDLHLERARDPRGRAGDFGQPPLWLYPAEVLAVRAVRRTLGLRTPKVEHPLMFTNLATTAPDDDWPSTPLLERVERAARRP